MSVRLEAMTRGFITPSVVD